MRRWLAVLALWPVLGSVGGKLPAFPSITDKTFIEECVRGHNNCRAKVRPAASNMRYMTWDAALARTARAWANKCLFKHNVHLEKKYQCHPNFTSVGENIWLGSYQMFTPIGAIESWYNEVRFYTFETHGCTAVCGHYTQVVWDHSYKVGCAVALCKRVGGVKNAAIFVCNYAPGGNSPRKPYAKGASCSNCAKEDTCENKLCRNPQRDKIIYYSRWNPPWEFRIVCDEACIALAVLRPSVMFLAFIAACFIKKRFINMHMST
ncbi:GLIPR1-like protein 1 [Apteryx mantelli]|uniref:GLIPR1-like protein 1 n=1 Tax=Apteryx mantelli TaxID=2696672 RepID=A0ABM4E043_9AVES